MLLLIEIWQNFMLLYLADYASMIWQNCLLLASKIHISLKFLVKFFLHEIVSRAVHKSQNAFFINC